MRLNILLNKINWPKTAEHICCVCLFLVVCCAFARADGNQVTIETGAMTYSEVGFAVDVTVKFEDMSLYNDQVYLSYHIVDEDGGELLFENQRIPVNLEAAFATIYVDCANLEELADRETAVIQFDLVDQKNIYWFSQKMDIAFQSTSVVFDRALLRTSGSSEQTGDIDYPAEVPTDTASSILSIMINLAAWVLLVVLICTVMGKNHKNKKGIRQE